MTFHIEHPNGFLRENTHYVLEENHSLLYCPEGAWDLTPWLFQAYYDEDPRRLTGVRAQAVLDAGSGPVRTLYFGEGSE